MRRQKRPLTLLILTVASLGAFLFLIFSYSPNYNLQITNYNLPAIAVFFSLLFLFFFSFFSLIFSSKRRGLFIGLFVVSYLLLRLNQLNNIFFLLILLAVFVILELFFIKK